MAAEPSGAMRHQSGFLQIGHGFLALTGPILGKLSMKSFSERAGECGNTRPAFSLGLGTGLEAGFGDAAGFTVGNENSAVDADGFELLGFDGAFQRLL